MAGLAEFVTVRKSPTAVVVHRANGALQALDDVVREDGDAHRARYGALDPKLEDRLERELPAAKLPLAIFYRVPELDEPAMDDSSSELLAAHIAERVQSVATWLRGHEFIETGRARYAPALFGTMPASAVAAIAHDDRLAYVVDDEPVEMQELAVHDPVVKHRIDTTWNANGNYASGQKVGLIEVCQFDDTTGKPAYLYDKHQAFAFNSAAVAYAAAKGSQPDCKSSEECTCNGRCLDGYCVSNHASQVASVVSASTAQRHGAAEIALYLPNRWKPITLQGHIDSYEWLIGNGVRTVNESFGGGGWTTADYYARTAGVAVVKAAGNSAHIDPDQEACPNTANSLCVGATTSAGGMACYSHYNNPTTAPDREEPDVVAFGGEDAAACGTTETVRVHGFSSTSDWSGWQVGTSFAAPTVTSLIAHLRVECAPFFASMSPRHIRALLRTAAWSGNPEGPLYSTPINPQQYSTDYKDGGGWVAADAVDWFCQSGTSASSGDKAVDLTRGADMPRGKSTYTPGKPEQSLQPDHSLRPAAYNVAEDPNFARKQETLAEQELRVGDRVRFTIAWDVCATSNSGGSAATVGIDIDLFLYNATTQQYVWGSQSIADNNEGFDYTIKSTDGDGRYRVLYAWPKSDQENCGTSSAVDIGWAGRWGSPW